MAKTNLLPRISVLRPVSITMCLITLLVLVVYDVPEMSWIQSIDGKPVISFGIKQETGARPTSALYLNVNPDNPSGGSHGVRTNAKRSFCTTMWRTPISWKTSPRIIPARWQNCGRR